MENKIKEYVNRKFEVCPSSKKLIEFQEKLILMMIDKYRDCLYCGMSKQKSYGLALSVMNNYSKEKKLYEAKANEDGPANITACHVFGGIA